MGSWSLGAVEGRNKESGKGGQRSEVDTPVWMLSADIDIDCSSVALSVFREMGQWFMDK